jgi:hypothetical protein
LGNFHDKFYPSVQLIQYNSFNCSFSSQKFFFPSITKLFIILIVLHKLGNKSIQTSPKFTCPLIYKVFCPYFSINVRLNSHHTCHNNLPPKCESFVKLSPLIPSHEVRGTLGYHHIGCKSNYTSELDTTVNDGATCLHTLKFRYLELKSYIRYFEGRELFSLHLAQRFPISLHRWPKVKPFFNYFSDTGPTITICDFLLLVTQLFNLIFYFIITTIFDI